MHGIISTIPHQLISVLKLEFDLVVVKYINTIMYSQKNTSLQKSAPDQAVGIEIRLPDIVLLQSAPRFIGIKRFIDIIASCILLLVLSPVILLIAVILYVEGGSAFFGHIRVGWKGITFRCFKFRTMVINSEVVLQKYLDKNSDAKQEWIQTHKLRYDPRITRFGSFLRNSSLDELPQLLNVLKGDMSLVGPRPIVASEVAKYKGDIAYYYSVRPGITGLWQVSGRNNLSYSQRVRIDRWYVRNWSLAKDFIILLKTIPAIIRRDGAY